jgi:DNA uptake protein ComE-like DNA-binding protein
VSAETEPAPPPPPPVAAPSPSPPASEPAVGGALNLNQATYEQLREQNLSVTQTGRVLAYRDRVGGFKSLDELESIPGFPHSFLEDLKAKLTL